MKKELLLEMMPADNDKSANFIMIYMMNFINNLYKSSDCFYGDNFAFQVNKGRNETEREITCRCFILEKWEDKEGLYSFINSKLLDSTETFIYTHNEKTTEIEFYINTFKGVHGKIYFEEILGVEDSLQMTIFSFKFNLNLQDIEEEHFRKICYKACHNLVDNMEMILEIKNEFLNFQSDFLNKMAHLEKLADNIDSKVSPEICKVLKNAFSKYKSSSRDKVSLDYKLWVEFKNKKLEKGKNIIEDYLKFVYYLWESDFYFISHYEKEENTKFTRKYFNEEPGRKQRDIFRV